MTPQPDAAPSRLPDFMTPPFPARPDPAGLGRVHFVGMGGTGMSAVADLLLDRGLAVSGSDAKDGAALEVLRRKGAAVYVPQDARNVEGADTVVVSTAIREDNPELAAARAAGLRVLHRSDALAAAMGANRTIAVAGTHGKTTTSSMIAVMLDGVGARPSFAVGATIATLGTNAALGEPGEDGWFVAEADESDGSFVKYRPAVAVVTNVEADHLDFYGSAEAVAEAFERFAQSLAPGGVLVACQDDPGSRALAERRRAEGAQTLTYGTDADADVRISDVSSDGTTSSAALSWSFRLAGRELQGRCLLRLSVPGVHNQRNAAAGVACALIAGVDPERAAEALGTYTGAARRFEFRGEAAGVQVFDDYAHHPTEVAAALQAARTVAAGHNVYALFQPHLFSRTREFSHAFAEALSLADRAFVVDIFPAREEPIEGVTSRLITEAGFSEVRFASSAHDAAARIASLAAPGDVVMTIGAGDVTEYGAVLLAALGEAGGDRR
ncbi:UDP-N-acetylmuramate--L-alanine ligase [Rothia sp. AR01]|uniref:UDP-N-acetylmuramate--L-alanine ligase n=1 Tax=Rothia santali TaxID=2949643 RepID=A0A9X2HMS6_9MICC|nr:UDP-N-acetylmuramate--L-alanine ligase [Rothia santali]MCP3427213.1 UDP-N-acetylmuramate--L-alanine ligase [Rothia santali]